LLECKKFMHSNNKDQLSSLYYNIISKKNSFGYQNERYNRNRNEDQYYYLYFDDSDMYDNDDLYDYLYNKTTSH